MYHLIILYNMYYAKSIYTVGIILARLLHTYSSCTAVTVGVLKTIAIVTIIATIITIAIVITVASVVNVGTEVLKRRKRRCGGSGSVALPLKKVYKPPALSQQTFAAYSRTFAGSAAIFHVLLTPGWGLYFFFSPAGAKPANRFGRGLKVNF